jgi:hypothetical protein
VSNINIFWSLADARVVITDWKHQYNHHSLGTISGGRDYGRRLMLRQ